MIGNRYEQKRGTLATDSAVKIAKLARGVVLPVGDPPSSRRRAVAQQTVGASLLAMLLISKYRQIASKLAPTDSGFDLIYAYKTMSYFLFDKSQLAAVRRPGDLARFQIKSIVGAPNRRKN